MLKVTRKFLLLATVLIGLGGSLVAGVVASPVVPVSPRNAVADAQSLASRHEGAQVMRIAGTSMLPFFGEGAVIVVKPVSENRLRSGMVVVYRNRFNEVVAHRLVAREGNAWIARGYNNEASDSTPVTTDNLLGVVYATFHAGADSSSSLPVALAAPAR